MDIENKIKASDFEYNELEEIDDPIRLVLEEYVKPRQEQQNGEKNGRS